MPFEVGLAVATARWRPAHQWFLFEAKRFKRPSTSLVGSIVSCEISRAAFAVTTGRCLVLAPFRDLVVVATDFATREVA